MAPTYRTATQTRRGNRGAVEVHDDFEGLPVRQWRRTTINVAPPKPVLATKQNDVWLYEQIHGMPKDWNQLPLHNQELLRAARAGYLNQKPEDDKEKEKDKSTANLASFMFTSSKSVMVSGTTGRRTVAGAHGNALSKEAAQVGNGGPASADEAKTANPKKRASPSSNDDPQANEPNKRQALDRKPLNADQDAAGKNQPSKPQSDLDREIELAKTRAKASGEDVDIVVEYKFKVSDPAKARPTVRVVAKNKDSARVIDTETAQEKRERRRERLKNSKEGLQVEVWRAVPRSDEGAGLSYLAKRHKNTVTLAPKAAETQATGPTVTRAKVRRLDAAGNSYEQTITLEEGQTITDGEIISTTVILAPSGLDAAPAQVTPVKRRPPPPKRKGKGPGRGRKKGKLPIPVSTRPAPADGAAADPVVAPGPVPEAPSDTVGTAVEGAEGPVQQDTEMADSSAVHSDDEEGDDGDEEEGEDGGDAEEAGDDEGNDTEAALDPDQDQEMKDASALEIIRPVSIEEPGDASPISTSEDEPLKARSKSNNPLNLVPVHLNSPRLEGSPLKNVVSVTPTNRSPAMSPSLQATSFDSNEPMDIDIVTESAAASEPSQAVVDVQESAVSEDPTKVTVEPVGVDKDADAPLSAGDSAAAPSTSVDSVPDVTMSEGPATTIDEPTVQQPSIPETQSAPEPTSELEPESKPEAEPAASSESKPESEPEPKNEAKPELEMAAEPEPVPELEPKPEREPEVETGPAAEPHAQPEPELQAEPQLPPQLEAQPEPQQESQPEPQQESQPEPESAPPLAAHSTPEQEEEQKQELEQKPEPELEQKQEEQTQEPEPEPEPEPKPEQEASKSDGAPAPEIEKTQPEPMGEPAPSVPELGGNETPTTETEPVESDPMGAKPDEMPANPPAEDAAVADKPVADKPVADKPVADKPVADKPDAVSPAPLATGGDEDDGMPDLLGGLEAELDRQAGVGGSEETSGGKTEEKKEVDEKAAGDV